MRAARIVDGVIADVVEIPEGFEIKDCFVEGSGYIEAPDHAIHGGTHINGKFGPVPPPEIPKWTEATLRIARDRALRASDWTQLPDVPDDVRERWQPYRQALWGLMEKYPDPSQAVFPTEPGE